MAGLLTSHREGLDLVGLWDGSNTSAEQPREESGRSGAAHAAIRHAELPVRSPPHPRGVTLGQGAVPQSQPQPQGLLMLGLEQVYCAFLAKATQKAGEAGWVDEAERQGRRA